MTKWLNALLFVVCVLIIKLKVVLKILFASKYSWLSVLTKEHIHESNIVYKQLNKLTGIINSILTIKTTSSMS